MTRRHIDHNVFHERWPGNSFASTSCKHGLVQAQLGAQLLKPGVLIGQLPELARLVRFQTGVFFLPAIKRLLRNAD
jgi:hypothetical protein